MVWHFITKFYKSIKSTIADLYVKFHRTYFLLCRKLFCALRANCELKETTFIVFTCNLFPSICYVGVDSWKLSSN